MMQADPKDRSKTPLADAARAEAREWGWGIAIAAVLVVVWAVLT